jgi:hypothetical protein
MASLGWKGLKKKANTVSKTFGEYSPCPFSSCYSLYKDGWTSILFLSALAIETVESWLRILKPDTVISIHMLQIYVFLEQPLSLEANDDV